MTKPKFIPESKPHPPRFQVGDEFGHLEVEEQLGRSHTNPETGRHLAKPMHWYRVVCDCGTHEVVNQGQLIKDKRQCSDCGNIARGRSVSEARSRVDRLPGDVEKALRSKW